MANLQSALKELRVRTASAESDAQRDAMRANEVEHRALDLRRELDQAHQTLTAAHSEHRAAMQAHEAELRAVREDARQAETLMRAELAASRRQQRALMQIASGAKASTPFNSGRYSEKGDP
jgi:hypothetical protein